MKTKLTAILLFVMCCMAFSQTSFDNRLLSEFFENDMITVQPLLNAPAATLPSDVINALNYYQGKIISLAETMPEENYGWRPAEGVRSIGEVYVHISMANYFFFTFFGHQMPEGYGMELEKTKTAKDEIIAEFKPSFEYAKSKLSGLSDEDFNKTYDFFGNKVTGSAMLLIYLNHAHEHLGQSIAYARMNGVTPPWSSGDH